MMMNTVRFGSDAMKFFGTCLAILVVFGLICSSNGVKIDVLMNSAPSRSAYANTEGLEAVLFTLFGRMLGPSTEGGGVGGGTDCVGCTAVVALIEQYASIHNKSVQEAMDDICSFLPSPANEPCNTFVNKYGIDVILLLDNEETPDRVCRQIKICSLEQCNLFPPPTPESRRKYKPSPIAEKWKAEHPSLARPMQTYSRVQSLDPWKLFMDEINKVFNSHLPAIDMDNDTFSTLFEFRGTAFRGKDCDDFNGNVYPGRQQTTYSPDVDHNCNGIYGTNEQGESYEDLFCSGTQQIGYAILGDSAAAHFHVPPQWVTAADINKTAFADLLQIASVEFDWPFMSAGTGYTSINWSGVPVGPVDSTYLRIRQQNLCAHRDYQNMGVNGARSTAMANSIMYSFRRRQNEDQPVILAYALIGNDVCNPHYGMSHMTTPQEFYTAVTKALDYFDTVLPYGSQVTFEGLVDGRILYDSMHARIHPIGSYRNDVTYAQFYDYFNCLEVSPCFGWMNSNATWRNLTSERAAELNQVYVDIIANHTYEHFNMTFFEPPLPQIVAYWEAQGGETWQLIEPVDGFHPNQITNFLTAELQWNTSLAKYPYLIPPLNPNNADIERLFGDQGGY